MQTRHLIIASLFNRFIDTCSIWCLAINFLELKNFNLQHGIIHIPMELPWSSPGFVNVYFIEEKDGYVMIDCGVNGSEYQELLETKNEVIWFVI